MRKRTRAVTILDAREEPRPSSVPSAAAANGSPSPSEQLLSPLSNLLLSPLSSVDLSAEPLSPTTTAAFQAARTRYLSLQQQPRASAPDQAVSAAPRAVLPDPALPEGILEECGEEAEGPPAEISSFLDDLLAAPQNSIFAPQPEEVQKETFVGDPGKDPPPWQPLKSTGAWAADNRRPSTSSSSSRAAHGSWSMPQREPSDGAEVNPNLSDKGKRPPHVDVKAAEGSAASAEADNPPSVPLSSVKSQEVMTACSAIPLWCIHDMRRQSPAG